MIVQQKVYSLTEKVVFTNMLTILCILIPISDVLSQRQKLTVGLFLNDETMKFGMHRSGPLVNLGVQKLKYLVEDHVDVEIIQYISLHGSECNPDFTGRYGNIAVQMYHKRNVTAFLGPTCSVAVEFIGRLAAQWNLAILTSSGSYEVLENKNVFKTLTRLAFNYKRVADFYMSVFSNFNWTDISILYEGIGSRLSLVLYNHNAEFAKNLHTYLSAAGVTSTLIQFSSEEIDGYEQALRKGNKVSRVFLPVCDNVALRGLMLTAHPMGMTTGDHVFLYFFYFSGYANGEIKWAMGNEDDQTVKKAFESIFLIGEYQPQAKEYQDFQLEMKRQSLEQYNFSYFDEDLNPVTLSFYEAFSIYGSVVKETIIDGMDYTNGLEISRRLWNRTFEDIHGKTIINSNGDKESIWMILDLNPETGNFTMVGYGGGFSSLNLSDPTIIHWPNGKGPPVNKPRCGFTGDAPECNIIYDNKLFMVLSLVLLVMILVFSAVVIVVYRKIKRENEMHSNWWKISWEDISWLSHCYSRYSHLCLSEAKLRSSSDGVSMITSIQDKKVATYKGSKVYLYKLAKNQMPTTRLFYMELSQMRGINCPHLTKLFGLTKNESNIFAVTEFCTRGDLRDILSNDSFVLNREFSISLIRDIIQAMEYIHSSNIRYHGSLHSRNCVIDSRFVLKVTNFGLQSLREFNTDCHNESCLWIAPELLRKSTITLDCLEMQCADVYSFGIIMYEVISRKEPFEDEKEFLTLKEIVSKLKAIDESLFRPQLNTGELDTDVINMMKQCWREDPKERPSFQALRKESRNLQWDRSGDQLLDNLLSRMEEYANNLEDLIEQRTQSLIEEKKRSEELLYQVLPRSVANKLKSGHVVDPEAYTCVTIYFSDIVGFTRLSSESTPMQVIDLLNDLYICFDKIIEHFDVYKVETIGDAYMVVSGLPTRNGDQHVVEIAKMSCSILESLKTFKIKHMPDRCLHARIGIHSGPVCAGVVGRKMPRYCLFGDTVNTASRMESNGQPMKIHISENTRNLLQNHPDFLLEERGEIPIKGKGFMRTFWLQNRVC